MLLKRFDSALDAARDAARDTSALTERLQDEVRHTHAEAAAVAAHVREATDAHANAMRTVEATVTLVGALLAAGLVFWGLRQVRLFDGG